MCLTSTDDPQALYQLLAPSFSKHNPLNYHDNQTIVYGLGNEENTVEGYKGYTSTRTSSQHEQANNKATTVSVYEWNTWIADNPGGRKYETRKRNKKYKTYAHNKGTQLASRNQVTKRNVIDLMIQQ